MSIEPLSVGTAMERVALGVQHLDTVRPDWRDDVKIDTLALESPKSCVIGQLVGDFINHSTLGLNNRETVEFGFELDWTAIDDDLEAEDINHYPYNHQDYSLLTECWVFAINR